MPTAIYKAKHFIYFPLGHVAIIGVTEEPAVPIMVLFLTKHYIYFSLGHVASPLCVAAWLEQVMWHGMVWHGELVAKDLAVPTVVYETKHFIHFSLGHVTIPSVAAWLEQVVGHGERVAEDLAVPMKFLASLTAEGAKSTGQFTIPRLGGKHLIYFSWGHVAILSVALWLEQAMWRGEWAAEGLAVPMQILVSLAAVGTKAVSFEAGRSTWHGIAVPIVAHEACVHRAFLVR